MIADASVREALASICHVVPEDERALYAVDGLLPQAVAYPKTAEQVSRIVSLAAQKGWAVTPWGGGTQIALGDTPRAVDVVVCTTDMAQVVEYQPADLTCTVQAGMRLSELQRRLAEHGQFLALDPPLPDRATVGGIIAANSSGPLRLRYGTVRDALLGIKVVNAGGVIAKAGGRVVKNVTGYDLGKLHTGALGTLGVIVEATFKLWPVVPVQSTVLAGYPTLEKAWGTARSLFKSALPLRACELLSPPASEGRGFLLAAWVGGSRAAVDRQNADVTDICSAGYAPKTKRSIEVIEGANVGRFWERVESFGRDRYDTIAKLSVQPSRMGELLAGLPEDAAFISHALSGVAYVFGGEHRRLAAAAEAVGGYLVLEKCPNETKQAMSVWGRPGPDFAVMRRIKEQFDPQGILNPGRYVGGL